MSLPLLVPVWRCGVRLLPTLRFPPGVARRAGALAMEGLGTLVAPQLSVIGVVWLGRACRSVAAIYIFQWTQVVLLIPYAVLVLPLATAVFTSPAEIAS